jgi:hypothetical protein
VPVAQARKRKRMPAQSTHLQINKANKKEANSFVLALRQMYVAFVIFVFTARHFCFYGASCCSGWYSDIVYII